MTVIEKEGVYESSLYPSPELRYRGYIWCTVRKNYDVNTSKMVHKFDLPPLCIQLYHNHFTALMYKSESSLQLMPVLHGRRYRRI